MGKITLGEVAIESKATWKSDKVGVPIVGLEHLEPSEITLSNWEIDSENTFTKKFSKGQVLLGRRRVYLRKAVIAPVDGICSGDITVIEAIPGKILPELLPFVIQNDKFFDYAVQGSAGSLSPRVKWEHLKKYSFELPSIDEQKILANKLWAAYRLKESYKKLLSATDEMVKSQFIEMFGSSKEQVSLSSLCKTFQDGDWIEEKDQSDSGIRLIQTGNVGNGYFKYTGEKARYISEETFRRLNCTEIFAGDILVSRLPDPVGRACIIPEGLGKCITAVDCTIIRLGDKILPEYFIWFTRTHDYAMQIKKVLSGTTRLRVSRAYLGKIQIPAPSIDHQKAFVAIAEQADKSKFELRQVIDKIDRVIKSSL